MKQHFYGFYHLVNIYSYFIRMVELRYWGNNNLDGFQREESRQSLGGCQVPVLRPIAMVLHLSLLFALWPQLAQLLRASRISEKDGGVLSATLEAEVTRNRWETGTC